MPVNPAELEKLAKEVSRTIHRVRHVKLQPPLPKKSLGTGKDRLPEAKKGGPRQQTKGKAAQHIKRKPRQGLQAAMNEQTLDPSTSSSGTATERVKIKIPQSAKLRAGRLKSGKSQGLKHNDMDSLAQTERLPPHLVPSGLKSMQGMEQTEARVSSWLRPSNVKVEYVEPPYRAEVPSLAHGLDRALFNPSVYWLQDPHSRVYNFEPYLQKLIPPDDFAYDRLMPFVPAAQDQELWDLAEKHDKTYIGSTSGMTGIMSHIYWLLSRWRPLDTRSLSADFAREPNTFAFGARIPVSSKLRYRNGRYALDPDKDWDIVGKANSILMYLGTLMEKMLTMEPDTFARLKKSVPPGEPGEFHKREAYYYSKTSKMLMRSQLDCHDPRLPGTGTFDLKTRGVIPIRRDRLNYVDNSGYLIRYSQGLFESFEREYYDMMRSAFLKYNFQVRIGNMDGIFVAYHNTAQIFGFQYITKEEMDIRLFGSTDMADDAYHLILGMMESIFDKATSLFPKQTLQLTFETLEGQHAMYVWVQPDEWDENSDGPRPIIRLDVQTQSFLDGELVAHPIDYDSMRKGSRGVEWSVKYRITQSSLSDAGKAEALAGLKKARGRQQAVHSMYLPPGIGAGEMLAKFDTMDVADIIRARQTPAEAESEHEGFIDDGEQVVDEEDLSAKPYSGDMAGKEAEQDHEEAPTKNRRMRFIQPGGFILQLRRLAKAGAEESKRMQKLEGKMEKVVWRPRTTIQMEETLDTQERFGDPDPGEGSDVSEQDTGKTHNSRQNTTHVTEDGPGMPAESSSKETFDRSP